MNEDRTPGFVIERRFQAAPATVWTMWTTEAGLAAWWGPIGFESAVRRLDLRVGGGFEIAMRAVGREQVAYLSAAGIPLESTARGEYVDIEPGRRLAWRNVVDFVAGVAPYGVACMLELAPAADGGTLMTFRSEAMHDAAWTGRAQMGWAQQVDKLAALVR